LLNFRGTYRRRFKVVSLFSGAGGLDAGFVAGAGKITIRRIGF